MSALTSALLVALGGASGALLRSGADALTARLGIAAPIGTLVVNVGGSFAAGLVVTLIANRLLPDAARPSSSLDFSEGSPPSQRLRCSSHAWARGELLALIAFAVGSILLGLLAALAGVALGRAL